MRVLVIGGTGFISKHIVRQLANQDHVVAAFHRGHTKATLPEGVLEMIDSESVMPIQRFPAQVFSFRPEVVIHTVAMGADDAQAAVHTFAGRAGRLVLLSSGDVYRAYGRFTQLEPGPIDEGLLPEDAPLRTKLYPYRRQASSCEALQYWYEKILAERAVLSDPALPGTILRLPKVYGPDGNEDLATIYRYRNHPDWRWTHGFVENVAAAVVLVATHPLAGGIYNVGEAYTPTIAERLAKLPLSTMELDLTDQLDFAQNMAYDTSRIRVELGYRETVSEEEGFLRTLHAGSG
ncbi:MAG TPA: NAD-dependent epimerase/dehydratase family protein [Acidobacteriaceae bacterium]|nr:NAD-dependent epimerase/dehydratase family protein [Acidobacteriaceae bacterium]